jgi:hypothetical protein
MADENFHFRKLVESLRLLILPAEKQAELFEPFVDVVFEVLDSYQNAFLLTPALIEREFFSFIQIANMIRLNNFIAMLFSSDCDGHIDDSDKSKEALWRMVRSLALDLLDSLGESHGPVDPAFL